MRLATSGLVIALVVTNAQALTANEICAGRAGFIKLVAKNRDEGQAKYEALDRLERISADDSDRQVKDQLKVMIEAVYQYSDFTPNALADVAYDACMEQQAKKAKPGSK